MDSELSEKLEVKVWMHQGSALSHFLYSVVVDVTEFARDGAPSELLHADDFVLMSETIEGLRNKLKLREAFENKGLKANLGKNQYNGEGRH